MKNLIIHPLILSIFPIIFFFANNEQNYPINVILLPTIISTSIAILLWLFLNILLKNKSRSAVLVSFFVLLFFSYGHLYDLLKWRIDKLLAYSFGKNIVSAEEAFLLFWGLIFLAGTYFLLIKVRTISEHFTKVLNITAIFLLFIPIVKVGIYEVSAEDIQNGIDKVTTGEATLGDLANDAMPPDIYYIILDGYGRSDVLKEVYNHDNDEFLNYLIQKGFYVADRSRSNYCQTALSLTSSLNMQYLDDMVASRSRGDSKDRKSLKEFFDENEVVHFLKKRGFRFVAFSSGYLFTEMKEADIYLEHPWSLDEFQNGLICTTALPTLLRSIGSSDNLLVQHREKILYTLQSLTKIPEYKSPVFTFAHLPIPHPPFVFGPNGERLSRKQMRLQGGKDGSHIVKSLADQEAYLQSYRDQLIFLNQKIKETVDAILANSRREPIIIIQSDHGPGAFFDQEVIDNTYMNERFSILNTYYLPNNGSKFLSRNIAPVNTFRFIFNHYFGTNFPILKNKSFYSTWTHPFRFTDITETLGTTDLSSFIASRNYHIGIEKYKVRGFEQKKYCLDNILDMSIYGIKLYLGEICHAKQLKIGLDDNDDYELRYFKATSVVARQTIQRRIAPSASLAMHALKIPTEAVLQGYDQIQILPIMGDGQYRVGKVQLL